MTTDNVSVRWVGKGICLASTPKGHSIVIDVGEGVGAMDPGLTLLSAVGGCAIGTLFWIMKKMRKDLQQNIDDLRLEVSGELSDGDVNYFNHIYIKYFVEGRSINKDALEKALHQVEKYCTVSLTVSGKAKIEWSYELIEK